MSTYSAVSEAIESLTVLQNKLKVLSDSVDGIARKLDAEVIAQEPDETTIADKTYINELDENHWYNCSVFHFENLGFALNNRNVLIVAVSQYTLMNERTKVPAIDPSNAFVCQLDVPNCKMPEGWGHYFTNKFALIEWAKKLEWKNKEVISFWFKLI